MDSKNNKSKVYFGFTLIELLIVIVIVGALVAIGLPKYQRAAERGRALSGINNAKYAAEYAAVKCMVTDGQVKDPNVVTTDLTKDENFSFVGLSFGSNCAATATFSRNASSGWSYTLAASTDEDGSNTVITCTSSQGHCGLLGLQDLGAMVPQNQ